MKSKLIQNLDILIASNKPKKEIIETLKTIATELNIKNTDLTERIIYSETRYKKLTNIFLNDEDVSILKIKDYLFHNIPFKN